jgi:predicted DNA-binding WGR domain protein
MAEKAQRQSSVVTYMSHQHALAAAYTKVRSKQDRGYQIAYAV